MSPELMLIAESFAESFVIAERDPTGKKISRRIDEDCHQPEKKIRIKTQDQRLSKVSLCS